MGMILRSFLILILSLAAIFFYNYNNLLQTNKEIPMLDDSRCTRVTLNSKGPEDVTYFNDDYLITATGNTIEIWYHYNKSQDQIDSGEIILISLKTKELSYLKMLNLPDNYKLRAHGIYVRNNLLYVLNHAYKNGGERLDVFNIDAVDKQATYVKTFLFSDELYGITNDVIVLDDDEESFFVTSWQMFPHTENGPNKLKHLIGIFAAAGYRVKSTYVYSCSFKSNECIRLENTKGIINNGITWNKDTKNPIVYVVDSVVESIKYYKIIKSNKHNTLEYINEYKVDYMVDNIDYSVKENRIYAGLIGRGTEYFKLIDYIEKFKTLPELNDTTTYTHSGSGYIDVLTGKLNVMNFNKLIRGGSTGLRVKDTIYYGSWGDNALVYCDDSN